MRGGFRGGGFGGSGDCRSMDDLYKPYTGPDSGTDTYGSSGGFGGGYQNYDAEPSQQIMVRNVSNHFPRPLRRKSDPISI